MQTRKVKRRRNHQSKTRNQASRQSHQANHLQNKKKKRSVAKAETAIGKTDKMPAGIKPEKVTASTRDVDAKIQIQMDKWHEEGFMAFPILFTTEERNGQIIVHMFPHKNPDATRWQVRKSTNIEDFVKGKLFADSEYALRAIVRMKGTDYYFGTTF